MCKILNTFSGCLEGSRFRNLYFVCMISVSGVKVERKNHRVPNLVILLILSAKTCVNMLEILF